METNTSKKMGRNQALTRFLLFSAIGIFMFFIPITIEKSSIPLDHLVTFIQKIPYYSKVYGLVLVFIGVILPFVNGSWKKTTMKKVFSIINILAIPFVIMAVFEIGPASLMAPGMIPFIYSKIVVPVTTIVPIGSIFLALIVSYGLMEFVGVFMRPIMIPIWKTPGRSAIDAVASFVGSYSIALLITNRVYTEGKYTAKEAAIIATGFSTVSATFMIIVAKTLGLMEMWTTYFFITVFVTFLVSAITARLYPLRNKPEEFYMGKKGEVEQDVKGNKFTVALDTALDVSANAPGLLENTKRNLIDGFNLAIGLAPSLLAIGTLGLILANYTPIFKVVGLIFYPVLALFRIPDAMGVSTALATSIAEMFLPAAFVAESGFATRFMVAVVCISEILFFSASIPCMMATEIPLKMRDYIIIWVERVILSIVITMPIIMIFFR